MERDDIKRKTLSNVNRLQREERKSRAKKASDSLKKKKGKHLAKKVLQGVGCLLSLLVPGGRGRNGCFERGHGRLRPA